MIFVNHKPIDKKQFPDGTFLLHCPEASEEVRLEWRYEEDGELFQLICLTRHLQNVPGRRLILSLPYLPNARMDRVHADDEVFTLKHFCRTINDLGFDRVEVLDAHSTVGLALLDRVRALSPAPYLEQVLLQLDRLHGKVLLYFPDEGAYKRYQPMLPERPCCYGRKKRDWNTGTITGLEVADNGNPPEGAAVLMVDDICSYGGTFYYSALALKERGAAALYSFATHTEMSLLEEKSNYLSLLKDGSVLRHFTTASLYTGRLESIEVVSPNPDAY